MQGVTYKYNWYLLFEFHTKLWTKMLNNFFQNLPLFNDYLYACVLTEIHHSASFLYQVLHPTIRVYNLKTIWSSISKWWLYAIKINVRVFYWIIPVQPHIINLKYACNIYEEMSTVINNIILLIKMWHKQTTTLLL